MKLVCGVGVNDADYVVKPTVDGRQKWCPYYQTWCDMLKRCYSERYQQRYPTYIGCSVAKEWHLFSNFKSWMITQDWQGKALDKDLIRPGNRVYSPDTCVFVDQSINKLLIDSAAARGVYPIGVSFDKPLKKFVAKLRINGKQKHLGCFTNPVDAHFAYVNAKVDHVETIQATIEDDQVYDGLHRHMSNLVMDAFAYAMPTHQARLDAWLKTL